MREMEYENRCEMESVMDRQIKLKIKPSSTINLNDIKQRQPINWNSIDVRKKYFESIK